MKKLVLLPFILLSVLSFGQIKNAGFDNWDTVNTHGYDQYSPTNWIANNLTGVERITDSFTGNQSIMIHTWYFSSTTTIYQSGTINFRPGFFRGFYKNIPGGENKPAHGLCTIYLTKTTGKARDTVAKMNFSLDTSSVFTPFQFPISYNSESAPDSFFILFYNGYAVCKGGACGFLYLDDIAFVPDSSLTVLESKELTSIHLYPNPTNGILNIENKNGASVDFLLFNAIGECVVKNKLTQTNNTIEISRLPAGIYFYNMHSKGKTIKTGKLIKN